MKNLRFLCWASLAISTTLAIWFGFAMSKTPDLNEVAMIVDEQLDKALLQDVEFEKRVEEALFSIAERRRREQGQGQETLSGRVSPPNTEDHIYGNRDAAVTLIEYSDFECPYCTRFHSIAKQLVDGSGGQVNWVYRHFPLSSHNPEAQLKAEASECVAELGGNEAFWGFTDNLYGQGPSGRAKVTVAALVDAAESLPVDSVALTECIESGRHSSTVQNDLDEGKEAGVTGTPGNLLYHNESGVVLAVHGAQPLNRLQQAVGSLLSRAR